MLPAAQAGEPKLEASAYNLASGDSFFLLTDSTFAGGETANVRLEASAYSSQIQAYGGADIVVYQVPQPLEFLKKQHNLHRLEINANYQGEGVANTLGFLWDEWVKRSRLAWQRLFSSNARSAMVQTAPALAQAAPHSYHTQFAAPVQYAPLPGLPVISRFRYPIHLAAAIAPPKDVHLEGSSSDFLAPNPGNVRVPLGKLKPGLYLVEAYIGSFRAHTLVFVADTVAITKISGQQLLIWTAQKNSGHAAAHTNVLWTDGAGVLKSGTTDDRGLLTLDKASPERSYVLGQDAQGGVFVSENFYYDSEIYATKLFAYTDRPLYRPGDSVKVKLLGRTFSDALHSTPIASDTAQLQVFDANGTQLLSQSVAYDSVAGGDTSFVLPDNAGPGGYQLHVLYKGDVYGAAFRVAHYVKPQYEIHLVMAKPAFKTGDAVAGKIQLSYPDGKPVPNARLTLTVKQSKLTLVDSELYYLGDYPVKLDEQELSTSADGSVAFSLPAASEPSRYVLSILSADQAAYRVSTTKEVLVQAGAGQYRLQTGNRFTEPGQAASFSWQALNDIHPQPSHWQAIRLENRETLSGDVGPGSSGFDISFSQPGTYSVFLKDAQDNVLGATSHWVAGAGLQVTPGSIDIQFDKDHYQAGDTAHALLTFDQPVDDALLTLERDRVEAQALLSSGQGWLSLHKAGGNQWRVDIPVRDTYGPNITFSVLYVKNGQYVFQNRGLVVDLPRVALTIKPERAEYQPGDMVNVDISAQVKNQPADALLTVSVVDEMVYALQPEIAPDIFDFFYHVRRNNVRTATSLNFHTYDLAGSPKVAAPESGNAQDRPFKVMERPRREDIDTAAWLPQLRTDAQGHVRISFRLPDSMTRWRITVRAVTPAGVVGQSSNDVLAQKPLYVKWIGPQRYRQGDAPQLSVMLFNPGPASHDVQLQVDGLDASFQTDVHSEAGARYIPIPVTINGPRQLTVRVLEQGKVVDALQTSISAEPAGWRSTQSQSLTLSAQQTAVTLPADASNLRLIAQDGAGEAFNRVLEDLIVYPWGCVEQTASRMVPLTLALNSIPPTPENRVLLDNLQQRLQYSRLRLVQMAGPDAQFSWWGNQTEGSAFMTTYAYYADWLAAKHLGLQLPAEHWQEVLNSYEKYGAKESAFDRAVILWWMQDMGLPTRTLLQGLLTDVAPASSLRNSVGNDADSLVFADQVTPLQQAMTISLLGVLAHNEGVPLPGKLAAAQAAAELTLRNAHQSLPRALDLLAKPGADVRASAAALLTDSSGDYPTIDRALTLIWLNRALGGQAPAGNASLLALAKPWQSSQTLLGSTSWGYVGTAAPKFSINLNQAPTKPVPVRLSYDSWAPENSQLPVTVERHLLRLASKDAPVAEGQSKSLGFAAIPVPDWKVSNDQLYVDEITLTVADGKRYAHGLLEVPLPPGADVEATTWGMAISYNGGDFQPLEAAHFEPGELSYAVPVPWAEGSITIRHLVRFSQKGHFQLPPARYWRMYQPTERAYAAQGSRVEVQ